MNVQRIHLQIDQLEVGFSWKMLLRRHCRRFFNFSSFPQGVLLTLESPVSGSQTLLREAESKEKQGVWDPMPKVDYNLISPHVHSRVQHSYHGQPYARVSFISLSGTLDLASVFCSNPITAAEVKTYSETFMKHSLYERKSIILAQKKNPFSRGRSWIFIFFDRYLRKKTRFL
jgi:hypothetical protein